MAAKHEHRASSSTLLFFSQAEMDKYVWTNNFVIKAKQHPGASESLRLLEAAGVDISHAISLLYDYGRAAVVKRERELRAWAGQSAEALARTQKLLAKTAKLLTRGLPMFLTAF